MEVNDCVNWIVYVEVENEDNFKVDVYVNDYLIAVNFNITKEASKISFIESEDTMHILRIFNITSYEDIGNIFIKKDIKSIEKNSFSIIKSKNYSNWHEAIAWLDAGEFLQLFFKNR